ncbi:MAG TPA: APC family permease [Ktedonobacteraceae bacterium]
METTNQQAPGESHATSQRLGRPVLTTVDAIAQSLAIGPVFSVAFLAVLIAGSAGSAAPLATLIGAVGVFAVGWVITLYARRYAGAGAIYDYLRRTTPALGLFAAGMYFIGTLFLGGAGIYLALGIFGNQTLQAYLGWNIPWWLLAGIAALLIFVINHFGIRIATRVQLTLSVLSIIPLLVLAIAIIVQGGNSGNTLQAFNPSSVPTSGLFQGILFAITLFIGFEASASLGEETADPRRSIPRAVMGTVFIAAVFYLLMLYASDIGFGLANSGKWASDPTALDTLATRYVGGWLAVLIDFALLFDMLAVASAFTATSSRGWFAMARHQLLPSFLARTSRYRTPLGGNLFVLAVALLLTLVTALLKIDVLTAFGITAAIGSLLIEAIYIGLALGAIRFLVEEPGKWWRWLFLLVAIVVPLLGLYGSVIPFPVWPLSLGVYCALAGVILSAFWTLLMMLRYPQRLGAASQAHAWE